jgi:hypothetical protein
MGFKSLMQRVLAGRNISNAAPEDKEKADLSRAQFRRYKRTYRGVIGAWTWAEWAKGLIKMPMGRVRPTYPQSTGTRRRMRMRAFYIGEGTPGAEERRVQLDNLHVRKAWGVSEAEWSRMPNLHATVSGS